jgi:hypothetical protein
MPAAARPAHATMVQARAQTGARGARDAPAEPLPAL